jgi:hypothetical protein
MPTIAVAMIAALLGGSMRAKRNPESKLRLFWKVAALFAIAFAGYIAIHGI